MLKIIEAEVYSTKIAVERPHKMAIGTTHHQENVILKLYAEGGSFGFGEAPHMVGHSQLGETPQTVRVILRDKIIPAILGSNVGDIERLMQVMDQAVPGNPRAKGAVVIAAYDLTGKVLGVPVHALLGGQVRDRIPLSWSLPIVKIDAAVEEGLRMVERGFRILKVKVGRPDPAEDVEMVTALRQAVGSGISLRVDANQAYDTKTALSVIRGIESLNIDYFEQPVHWQDLEGMSEVTCHSSIPIMADESAKSPTDMTRIVKFRAADYVSIYVIGTGGLLNSKKMAILAETYRMRAYVGGALESIIGASAGLHLAASSSAIDLGCEMYGQYMLKDDFGLQQLEMKEGALMVPTAPGLGFELNESKLEKYRQDSIERFTWEQ